MTREPLDALRSVDRADVYKGERLAGTLQRENGAVVFRYDAAYLADPTATAVARTLPQASAPVVATGGAVPAFFAGLLPEGIRLRAVVTSARTSEDDQFTLLLAVGEDTVGDVRVLPHGRSPVAPDPAVDAAAVKEIDLADLFRRVTAPSADLDRIALPGVQVKISAAMISTPLTTTSGPAILKLNPPQGYPRLVENEHFFLRMAAGCGLSVPEHALVHDRHGKAGLLVARFDRDAGGGTLQRLPQEDACQLLDEYPAAKYRLKTEAVARALADAVEDGDGSRPLALRRVLELVAFSYLVGNGDLHGKNLSVRQAPNGLWEVTPAYDLVSTQPYLSWRDPMALDLYGRANRLDRTHLVESFGRLGLPRRAAESTLDRISAAAPAWIDRVDDIGFDAPTCERLAGMIRRRLDELRVRTR